MRKCSELTFNELTKDLGFIKVWWNGKIVYDDTGFLPLIDLKDFYKEYGNRYVYNMQLKVVEGHHCELKIKGEKEFNDRKLVIGLYFADQKENIYEYDLVDVEDIEVLEKLSNKKLQEEITREISKHEYIRYLYGQAFVYKIKLKNADKYPWIHTCTEFYIIK